MHTRKIQPRKVYERVVTGENDVLRRYRRVRRMHPVFLHREDAGIFINGEFTRKHLQELQRVKLGLMGEADGSGNRKGQGDLCRETGREAQQPGGLGLVLHQRGILSGIEIGILFLKGAGNAFIPDDPAVIPDGGGIGLRILPGLIFAVLFQQCTVNIAVLGGDFGGGILCLAGGGAARFENHDAQAGFLEKPGGEQAGDAGADDRDVSAFLRVSRSRGAKVLVFAQRDSIKNTPLSRFSDLLCPEYRCRIRQESSAITKNASRG